jgi:hypothetical protein
MPTTPLDYIPGREQQLKIASSQRSPRRVSWKVGIEFSFGLGY